MIYDDLDMLDVLESGYLYRPKEYIMYKDKVDFRMVAFLILLCLLFILLLIFIILR